MRFNDIFICVPAYNAADTLQQLVTGVSEHLPDAPIVVVDDGSSDNTQEILASLPVTALTHEVNQGKGTALTTAFAHALEQGCRAVVQIDADLQHEPRFLPELAHTFNTGLYDILIGTRDFTPGVMPVERRFTNWLCSGVISWLAHAHIDDSQSGYRLLSRDVIENIHPETSGYEYEPEYLILAGRAGFRIGSVPISTVYAGSKSYIHPLKDSWRFASLAYHYKFGKHRQR